MQQAIWMSRTPRAPRNVQTDGDAHLVSSFSVHRKRPTRELGGCPSMLG